MMLQIYFLRKSIVFCLSYILTYFYKYSAVRLAFALGIVLFLTISSISLASAEQISLAWDDSNNDRTKVGGYRIYYWQPSWDIPASLDVGKQTTYTLIGLESGQSYSFAVTAHDGQGGGESGFSNIVRKSFSYTTAYDLDQSLGLEKSSDGYHENWGGLGEKWMTSASGTWYFITPDGNLYEWDGDSDLSTSTLIATLDPSYHTDPTTLHDASDPNTGGGGASLEQIAYELDQQLGLSHDGDDYLNWGGLDEKWMTSASETWYFITPDGSLYEWDGDSDLSTSTLIATLDSTYYDDPSKLYNAPDPNTGGGGASLEQIAYELDQQLGLSHDGDDHLNWGGLDEKWMTSASGKWYFITPDGSLYEWNGKRNLRNSTLIATLDSTYYDDPSKLYNASTP